MKFNLYNGIDLDEVEKKYLEIQDEVSDIVVNLISIRVKLGLSIAYLSKISDVSIKEIKKIETFKKCPNLETLLKLKHALEYWGYKKGENNNG